MYNLICRKALNLNEKLKDEISNIMKGERFLETIQEVLDRRDRHASITTSSFEGRYTSCSNTVDFQ
jgi:hypothetical protein